MATLCLLSLPDWPEKGIPSGAADKVEDGRVASRVQEIPPASQPGVFAAGASFQPG